jgi:putative addiction module killer protein
MGYNITMNYKIHTTQSFDKWSADLKDKQAALAVAMRLDRAANGNLGDIKPVGDGVSEMRIFVGQGYRLYFTIRNGEIIVLLCGGDKSTQQRDIKKAKELVKNL